MKQLYALMLEAPNEPLELVAVYSDSAKSLDAAAFIGEEGWRGPEDKLMTIPVALDPDVPPLVTKLTAGERG